MLTIWKGLLDLIFPPRPECPFCGSASPQGEPCKGCLAAAGGYRYERPCTFCGRLVAKGAALAQDGTGYLCRDCRKRDWPFTLARAAGPYEGMLKKAIHRFKYEGRRSVAVHLATLMVEACRSEPGYQSADLVVPVPLSRGKLRLRGFNQAELLAVEVGRALGRPVLKDCLVKDFDTPPQAGLKRAARESNLQGAFRVSRPDAVRGQDILLVDDVFTTGSTMSAAALALREAGAGRVFGLTAATGRCF